MIHPFKKIHDILFITKSQVISFLISNLASYKILNKTFGFYTLQSHTKCNVFNYINSI